MNILTERTLMATPDLYKHRSLRLCWTVIFPSSRFVPRSWHEDVVIIWLQTLHNAGIKAAEDPVSSTVVLST